MSGPFKTEDFAGKGDFDSERDWVDTLFSPKHAAPLANELDARRFACPKGGEHEPTKSGLSVSIRDGASVELIFGSCAKCGGRIEARWEAV